MIRINEVLPNPKGKDTGHEWIELYNDGLRAESLRGWRLQTSSNKKIPLQGIMEPQSYKVINQDDIHFTIKNKNEIIQLIDNANQVQDMVQIAIQAPEDKSWSKQDTGKFIFSEPTPLTKNNVTQVQSDIKYGVQSESLTGVISGINITVASMVLAVVCVGVIMYILKTYGTEKA
ncbi:MAG: Lamin Tail Domain [Candidatus Parcubacteria bacterium]|jgi:hypothetical protein